MAGPVSYQLLAWIRPAQDGADSGFLGGTETGVWVLQLLRQPVPRAIWVGQLLSATGDKLYGMAVLWLVLQLTGSAALMAMVSLAESIPYVVVGFLGAGLITRRGRLRAMIRLDLLSAAAVAVIPVTYLGGLTSMLLLATVAGAVSSFKALSDPVLQALLPDAVPARDLQPMIALADSTDRLARAMGPGSVGLLLLVMPEIHLLTIDAVTFLVSAAALATVVGRIQPKLPGAAGDPRPRGNLWDGTREILSKHTLRVGVAVRGSCNLVWPAFTIGVPFELTQRLHTGLASYGVLLAAFGAGNLAGNLFSGSSRVGQNLLFVYCMAWVLVGAAFMVLSTATSLTLAAAATASAGVFTPLANVSMDTHIADTVPLERLSRVYAAQRVTVAVATTLGSFVMAVAISATSGAAAIAIAGAWMLLTALFALTRIRRPGPSGRPIRRPSSARPRATAPGSA
jgi:MFS transporter, DHA3 family, macrolide efflux protein